jgi:hypothetical protein
MNIKALLKQARKIWGPAPIVFGLDEIIVAMGVVYGDICRWQRDQTATDGASYNELEKELGNLIFSTIRWCDDLGFDPEKCINRAIQCQKDFNFVDRRAKGKL